ncbi:MAG: AraC family transcriptional regulator [Candidatus Competibacteraceae bacterium]|nr:AraC family transcriptional regulator [Candidatus Competibacteraceae bacterium]
MANVPGILREFGCEPESIFGSVDLKLTQFGDPDSKISYIAASKLLARCAMATGCQHFGLLLGARADPSFLGITGFMLRAAPDVATALKSLVRHLDLHDQGGMPTLVTRDGATSLGYVIYQSGVEATEQIYDLSIAIACNIMRGLCGASWKPNAVLLSRRSPQDPLPYRRFFRIPPHFDAEQNALVFQARWLDHQLTSADHLLHRYLEQEANELHAHQNECLVRELRRLLRKSLASKRCAVTDIASQFCMHERTLHRRLRDEGTTFRRELEEVRYEVARQLLAESTMPLSKIATALEYADVTAFTRAFKRWSGISPGQWRVRNTRR